MQPKLIYLHIPKSGGTSEHTILRDLYSDELIYWHGFKGEPVAGRYSAAVLGDYPVIGGHRPLSFYPPELPALYVSVVREPIDRIVSLYSYYTRPEFAEDDFVASREKIYQTWQDRGMDRTSLLRSIEQCPQFRNEVANHQCKYLSRHGGTFAGVIKTIAESDIVIADLASVPRMNAQLSQWLNWGEVPQRKANRSRDNTHAIILQEPGLRAALSELTAEDQQLYDYIHDECGGLTDACPRSNDLLQRLQARYPYGKSANPAILWKKVQLYTKGFVGIDALGSGSASIVLVNNADTDINDVYLPGLSLCYAVHDMDGRPLDSTPSRTPFKLPINSGAHRTVKLPITIPTGCLPRARSVRIWLDNASEQSFLDHNPLHLAEAQIIKL